MFKPVFNRIVLGLLCYCPAMVRGDLVDPTMPNSFTSPTEVTQKAPEVVDLILSAILISDNSRVAIINNSVLKIGDTIGEDKVKSIDTYKVTLEGARGELELKLFANSIKESIK